MTANQLAAKVAGPDESQDERRLQVHQLEAAYRRHVDLVRTDDHGGVRAHPSKQLARLVEQVLEVPVGHTQST